MKIKISLLSLAGLMLALPASAAIFKTGETVDFGASAPITENVYLSGGMVTAKGEITGDINAVGGNISIGASSTGDISSAGGMVEVTGKAQDVRLAGGFLNVDATINGDLVAVGGFLRTRPDTTIAGDVLTGTGAAQLDGVFKGKVTVNGGEITLSGKFDGPVTVNAEKVVLTESAVLTQGAKVTALEPPQVATGAKITGEIVFEKMKEVSAPSPKLPEKSRGIFAGIMAAISFAVFLSTLVGGLVGLKLFKPGITDRTDYALRNFWLCLLMGFAALILIPIAVITLYVTVLGSFIATVVLSAFGLICILAKLIAMFLVGSLIWKYVLRKPDHKPTWKTLLVGLVVYYVVMLIPFLGWLFAGIMFCAGLGTLIRYAFSVLQKNAPSLAIKEK